MSVNAPFSHVIARVFVMSSLVYSPSACAIFMSVIFFRNSRLGSERSRVQFSECPHFSTGLEPELVKDPISFWISCGLHLKKSLSGMLSGLYQLELKVTRVLLTTVSLF